MGPQEHWEDNNYNNSKAIRFAERDVCVCVSVCVKNAELYVAYSSK